MKKFTCLVAFAVVSTQALAQNNTISGADTTPHYNNGFFAEVAGAAVFGVSFNYERHLSKHPGGFSARAGLGLGYLPGIFGPDEVYGVFPLGLSYNISLGKKGQNFLELGADYTFIFGTKTDDTQIFTALAGWRYESKTGKLFMRATIYPVFSSAADDDGGNFPWFGFSLGTRF